MAHYTFIHWVFTFIVYNFIGWCNETTIESLYHRRFINRGFLWGPYIPIYGLGGIFMMIVCVPFAENPFAVFVVGTLTCTLLEYFVGAVMEAVFKKQFWDYSMMRFVYKNRVSVVSSMFWGLMSLFMVYFLYNIIVPLALGTPKGIMYGFTGAVAVCMVVDACVQVNEQLSLSKRIRTLTRRQIRDMFTERARRFARPVTFLQKAAAGRLLSVQNSALWQRLPFTRDNSFDHYFDDVEYEADEADEAEGEE